MPDTFLSFYTAACMHGNPLYRAAFIRSRLYARESPLLYTAGLPVIALKSKLIQQESGCFFSLLLPSVSAVISYVIRSDQEGLNRISAQP